MVENKNSVSSLKFYDHSILESMPIESIQKEAIISDKEVVDHQKLVIRVSIYYILRKLAEKCLTERKCV